MLIYIYSLIQKNNFFNRFYIVASVLVYLLFFRSPCVFTQVRVYFDMHSHVLFIFFPRTAGKERWSLWRMEISIVLCFTITILNFMALIVRKDDWCTYVRSSALWLTDWLKCHWLVASSNMVFCDISQGNFYVVYIRLSCVSVVVRASGFCGTYPSFIWSGSPPSS